MKTTKRFLSIMIIAIMTFCLSTFNFTVSADETYSITVENITQGISIDDQTFNAYKVFAVTYDGDAYTYSLDNECLSPLGYGDDYTIEELQKFTTKEQMQVFGDYVYNNYIKNQSPSIAGTATASNGSAVIKVDKPGYYLVFGAGDNINGADDKKAVTSLVMCDTASPNATVNLKLDAPSLEKQIQHNETNEWGVVGDNQIGDEVNFRLITKVPSINGYSNYDYIIHDNMTDGLTYKEFVEIKVNDEDGRGIALDETYYTATGSNQNLTVSVDIKAAISAGVISENDELYTYYKATLNTAALKSDSANKTQHNDNEAYLEYSNNPYDNTSKGETPHVKVYDWTFAAVIHKVGVSGTGENKTIKDLAGAGFTIQDEDGTVKFSRTGTDEYTVDPNGTITEIITPENGTFKILGLDDSQNYTMEETTVPNGYSKCANVILNINADYNGIGNELTVLELNAQNASASGMTVTIENTSGKILVGTGGIGTTIFYIVGGALMAGAVVLIIIKKRINNK